jgi:hypothetical protein
MAPRNVWVPRSCLVFASRAAAAGLGVPARGSSVRTAPTVSTDSEWNQTIGAYL